MNIESKILIMGLAACFIGATVRIFYEKEKQLVKPNRVFFIYVCALAVAYIFYEAAIAFDLRKYIALGSIIGGVISVDLIKMLIEDLPGMVKNWIVKKIEDADDNRTN